jgi:hypothetical protein
VGKGRHFLSAPPRPVDAVVLSAYNVTNTLMRQDPDLNVQSSTFGQALRQSNFLTGRQVEIGLKFVF